MLEDNPHDLIRNRPEMFIGKFWSGNKWDNGALHVLVLLVMKQSVNPETLNQCTRLRVILQSDDKIVIEDNGVGLSVTPPSNFENSNDAALTHLLSWYMPTGNLSKTHYEEYGFLGYFAMLLNVLSKMLQIDTVRHESVYTVTCTRGEIVMPLRKTNEIHLRKGTRISFTPNTTIFSNPAFNQVALGNGIEKLAAEYPQTVFEFSVH